MFMRPDNLDAPRGIPNRGCGENCGFDEDAFRFESEVPK
jgi:hypothetical protein